MSTLKVNKIRDTAGSADAITLDPNGGAVIAGVTTVSTVKVGSGVTITSDGDIFHTGVCTATSFVGDAASLTKIPAANIVGVCTSGLTKTGGFGKIVQVVSTTKTDTASNSTNSQTWWSYTDSSLIATITPTSASNKILITGCITIGVDTQQWIMMRLEKNGSRLDAGNGNQESSASRCFTASHHASDANMPHPNKILNYLDTAGDTNSRYYNFGIAHTSGATRTLYLNKGIYGSGNFYDPRCVSTITVMEIEA